MWALAVGMSTRLKKLPPWQAWEDVTRRSMAFGVAGWAVVGTLQAAGAIPILYRPMLLPVSGAVSAFLAALTSLLAYYHSRVGLGVVGSALALLLPCPVNLLWVRFSGLSLTYPLVVLPLAGLFAMWKVHRRISGPRLEFEADTEQAMIYKAMIRKMTEKSLLYNLPLADRILWICITLGIVFLLLAQLIRWTS